MVKIYCLSFSVGDILKRIIFFTLIINLIVIKFLQLVIEIKFYAIGIFKNLIFKYIAFIKHLFMENLIHPLLEILPKVLLSVTALFVVTIVVSRISGLRTLAKFSTPNFISIFNLWASKQPMLLMDNGKFIVDHLRKTKVEAKGVYEKLREAKMKGEGEVVSVVLESTGDILVIHKPKSVGLSKDSVAIRK